MVICAAHCGELQIQIPVRSIPQSIVQAADIQIGVASDGRRWDANEILASNRSIKVWAGTGESPAGNGQRQSPNRLLASSMM